MKLPVLIGENFLVNATSLFVSFNVIREQAVSFINQYPIKVNQYNILNGRDIYV